LLETAAPTAVGPGGEGLEGWLQSAHFQARYKPAANRNLWPETLDLPQIFLKCFILI